MSPDRGGCQREIWRSVINVFINNGYLAYFTSTASWSQLYLNDDQNKKYTFDFDISDINIYSWYGVCFNRTGYEVDVLLNGNIVYNLSYIFEPTKLWHEYHDALDSGDFNIPPHIYFSIAQTTGSWI